MALKNSLAGFDFALGIQDQLKALRGPAFELSKAAEAARSLHDVVNPPGLRAIVEMQRSFEKFANPLGVRNTLVFQEHARLHDLFGASTGLKALMESAALHTKWADALGHGKTFDSYRSMQHAITSVGLHSGVLEAVRSAQRLESAIKGILPETFRDTWSTHLKTVALPAATFLSTAWDRPTGLLTGMDNPALGASLGWLRKHEDHAKLALAAIVERPSEQDDAPFQIEVEVVCAICDQQMFTPKQAFRWVGPRRGVSRVSTFPICTTCMKEAAGDPSFWDRALRDMAKPKLRVIEGEGQSQGRPKGPRHLRLVRDDDPEDDAL